MEASAPAPDTPVLIVGGGPTGLLLACTLRRRGVECVLVDAYDEPLGWDRAMVIHPRSLQIFEALGIVDEFTTTGVHIRTGRIHADGAAQLGVDDLTVLAVRPNREDIGRRRDGTGAAGDEYLTGYFATLAS
jgi:2-polyprenyl-6-methoxyphenol hydroxylase-like FAD-dependent oxidoreductase